MEDNEVIPGQAPSPVSALHGAVGERSVVERVVEALKAELGEFTSPAKLEAAAEAAINAAYEPADAGATARPWPYPDDYNLGPPRPDPQGPFLLIMHDQNQQGWLWLRRYRTKADALCIAANYTGKDQVWLFEVGQELDLGRELEGFWAGIKADAALADGPMQGQDGR